MEKEELKVRLKEIYDARLKNDVDRTLQYFSEGSVFRIAGDNSEGLLPPAVSTRTEREKVLRQLIESWEWIEFETWKAVIEENQVVVQYVLKLRFIPTGEVIRTEVVDVLTFDDAGYITELVDFVDTDQVRRLAANASS